MDDLGLGRGEGEGAPRDVAVKLLWVSVSGAGLSVCMNPFQTLGTVDLVAEKLLNQGWKRVL